MTKIAITVEIDTDRLQGFNDAHLAALWHVAQANPAPIEDRAAGMVAEQIGREIIRRWLRDVGPELWHHQGRHGPLADLDAARDAAAYGTADVVVSFPREVAR